MKSIRLFLLCMTGLLLQAKAGQAQSQLTACTIATQQQALTDVQQRVTLMKIAASKADFINLFAYANGDGKGLVGLDTYLEGCSKILDARGLRMDQALCDAECHVQRAQAWLFMISELPFLDTKKAVVQKIEKGSDIKVLDESARKGLAIVEDGLNNLSRMNQARTALKSDQPDKTTSDSFRGFLQDQARLQAIKVRLLLALGDRIYQNVSVTRVATLKKRINDVLSTGTTAQQKGSELYQAETLYDQAFWILQEAMIDVPKVGLQSEAFTLMGLKNEVDQRLTSVRNGYLFLNIDPEKFSTKSADELMDALQTNLKSLMDLEGQIEGLVKEWQGSKQDAGRRDIDNQRLRTQKDMEIDGYKIAELSTEAENLQNRYSQMLTNSSLAQQVKGLQSEVLEKQFYKAQLEFELQQTKAEVQGQIDVLKRQAALEVTALDKEAAADRRDNYKWLIDMTLTQYNLTLQIKQFESQIQDLTDQIGLKVEEQKSLVANIDSQKSLISVEKSHIAELDEVKKQIEAKKGDVYLARRQGLIQNICGLLTEKVRLIGKSEGFSDEAGRCEEVKSVPGSSETEYWNSVIKMREKYFNPDSDSGLLVQRYKELRDCMTVGKTCDGKENELTIMNKIMIREQGIWDCTTRPQLEAMKQQIRDHIEQLRDAKDYARTGQFALAAINLGAGGLWMATAGKSVSVGLGGGVSFDAGQQFQAAYQIAMEGAQGVLEGYKYGKSIDSEIAGLSEKISEIEKELLTMQATWEGGGIQAMQVDQAIAAAAGHRLELDQGHETLKAEYAFAIKEAEHAGDQALVAAKRIDAEIASIKAQLKEVRAEKELLTFDTSIADRQADQSRFRIQSMQFEIQSLQAQQVLTSKDTERLERLKKAALDQKKLTYDTLNSVDGLAKKVTSEAQVVDDLRNKEKAGQTALSKAQIDQLDAVLVQKTDFTEKARKAVNVQIALLNDQIKDNEATQKLSEQYGNELGQISGQITALSKSLVEKASQPDPTAGQEARLFLATEDMIADLTHGVPDFMAAKRQRLQYTNFLFNLFRNRMNTLYTIGDQSVPMDLVPYITGSSDLSTAMQGLCKDTDGLWVCDPTQSLAFAEDQVVVRRSEFSIPATSGFMSRLMSKGRVRFEITPDVTRLSSNDNEAMASSGYFMLWDSAKMSAQSNNSLVNIVVQSKFQDKSKCRGEVVIQVKHLGTGIRFTTMNAGSSEILPILVTRPPVGNTMAIFDGDLETASYRHYLDYFSSPFPMLRSFPESIEHHQRPGERVPLRFLGFPLVGAYEISMANQSSQLINCLVDQPLVLGFNYTDSRAH